MKQKLIAYIPIYELINITSPDAGPSTWSKKTLPKDHPLYVSGAITYTLSGKWGAMIFQHIPGKHFDIWISYYDVREPATFFSTGNIALIECCFELENDKLHQVHPFQPIFCKANTYNLYHFPKVDARIHFKDARPIATLDIHLKQSLLRKLQKSFPTQIKPVIDAIEAKTGMRLFHESQACTPEIKNHLSRLIQLLHQEGAEADIRDIVYPLLHACLDKPENDIKREISIVIPNIPAICSLMQSSFPERYTLKQLAQKMCMSRSSFVRAFSKEAGVTVDKYYFTLAMNTALHLVQNTTRSITQIASDTGYSRLNTFCRAFQRHFHKSPTAFRKK